MKVRDGTSLSKRSANEVVGTAPVSGHSISRPNRRERPKADQLLNSIQARARVFCSEKEGCYGYTRLGFDRRVCGLNCRCCHVGLSDVSASPEYKGNPIGSVLMDSFEDQARASGSTRLCLDVSTKNEVACRFYERRGWNVE